MKKVLVITKSQLNDKALSALTANGFSVDCSLPTEIESKDLSIYDAVMFGAYYLSKDILAKMSNVQIMSFIGTGYTSFIDTDYCNNNNIKLANTPGVNANAVAELAVGLMIDITRSVTKTHNQLKNGNNSREVKQVNDISSYTIGIAGFGYIGSKIADICSKGFGANVIYTSRANKNNEFKFVSKEELLSTSDIIFLCMSENSDTVNYITSKEFKLMKDSAFIINPSRPHLINGNDLYNALQSEGISGCAMDGYYSENPRCEDDKTDYGLFSLPEDIFINTPHIASKTLDAFEQMYIVSADNIINFFNNKKNKVHLVN